MSRRLTGQIDPEAGNRIREFRLRKRWSIQDLADESGFTYPTLQRWETTGKIPVKKLAVLARVLDCTPADLLPGSESPRIDDLSDEQIFLIERYEAAPPELRRAIIKSVKGMTDRDEQPLDVRPRRPAGRKR